jgi:HPt (histidine-containing phosphotransfer) domain-containing protein
MPDTPNDLDLSFLNEIADGSDEFIIESIDMFLEQAPEILEAVSTAISSRDWPAAGASAHKIKATLGFFGMNNCLALMQDVEHMCKTGSPDADDVSAKFNEVQGMINANLLLLEKIKAEKQANL